VLTGSIADCSGPPSSSGRRSRWTRSSAAGFLLVVGQSTGAFYLLALWVASGFALIVWNVWVLLAEVEE